MPSLVARMLLASACAAVCVFLSGCSDQNPKSLIDPNTGKHAANWLPAGHAAAASSGTTSAGTVIPSTGTCTTCHGDDLSGGITGVSCTSCHLGGPTSVHPLAWDPVSLAHGPSISSGAAAVTSCSNQYCHGTDFQGVAGSGPPCTTCHSFPFDPSTVVCGICHQIPPGGTAFPNQAGKHAKHATSDKTSCDICHNGASAYIGDHRDGVINFNFLAAYTPKTGLTPSFDASAKTCSNVSCHGGQITPSWDTGSLDVGTQCDRCHSYGTSQYNSYSSGEHYLHLLDPNDGPQPKLFCTDCHDTSLLAENHFTRLSTTAMEGPAGQTIKSSVQYDGMGCANSCHGQTYFSW